MKNRKFLIVQPHSDDALFSCSHLLLLPEYEVQVLTVENDPKRISEDERLFEFLGIPFHHLEVDFQDDSYYGYYKKTGNKDITNLQSKLFMDRYYDSSILKKIGDELRTFINIFLEENPDYSVVSPLGIGHPFHQWVFDFLQYYGYTKFCYREFPHSYKRKAKRHMKERLFTYGLNCSESVINFEDVKWKLASKFYRSQSGLLFFEQGYIKKNLPEEIYSPKSTPENEIDDLPF